MLRTELVGRTLKITREVLDRLDVAVSGSLSVIATLEFLEHHFAKVGHRSSPYDPTLSLHLVRTAPDTRHAKASAAKRLRSNRHRGDYSPQVGQHPATALAAPLGCKTPKPPNWLSRCYFRGLGTRNAQPFLVTYGVSSALSRRFADKPSTGRQTLRSQSGSIPNLMPYGLRVFAARPRRPSRNRSLFF